MKNNKINIVSLAYQFAMLFGFIANMQFGFITTRRVAILLAMLTIIFRWRKVRTIAHYWNRKQIVAGLVLLFGSLLITMAHSFSATPSSMNMYFDSREIITLLISIFSMGLWCAVEIKSFERFAWLVVGVVVVQAVVTYLTAVNQPLRIYIAEHFMSESYLERSQNVIYGMGGRAAGLGIAWSMGSLILAYGCFLLIALKTNNRINSIWFGILYSVVLGATALMGRTGLIVELGLLLYYGISGGQVKNVFGLLLIVVAGLFVLNQILSTYDSFVAEVTREWMMQFMVGEEVKGINEGVVKTGAPPFSSDFIFGTGLMLGNYKGYTFTADSGYIRSYTSIGVVGIICYYGGMLCLLAGTIARKLPKMMKRLIWVGIIALFAVEYKEPFIGMTVFPWLLFTAGLLLSRDYKTSIYENIDSRRFLSAGQIVRTV